MGIKDMERLPIFVTTFSNNFKEVSDAIKCYLPILFQDPVLDPVLKSGVQCVARKARSVGNLLCPGALLPVGTATWLKVKGFYRCGLNRCGICKFAFQTKTFSLCTDSHTFDIGSFINCATDHVIYAVTCTACNIQYIGGTIRHLKNRIYEHVYGVTVSASSIRNVSSVSQHFRDQHQRDLSHMQVIGIEQVMVSWEGWRLAEVGTYARSLLDPQINFLIWCNVF